MRSFFLLIFCSSYPTCFESIQNSLIISQIPLLLNSASSYLSNWISSCLRIIYRESGRLLSKAQGRRRISWRKCWNYQRHEQVKRWQSCLSILILEFQSQILLIAFSYLDICCQMSCSCSMSCLSYPSNMLWIYLTRKSVCQQIGVSNSDSQSLTISLQFLVITTTRVSSSSSPNDFI